MSELVCSFRLPGPARCTKPAHKRFLVDIEDGQNAMVLMCAEHAIDFGKIPLPYRVETLKGATEQAALISVQEAIYSYELVIRCPHCAWTLADRVAPPAGEQLTCPNCDNVCRMPKIGDLN